MSVWSWHTNLLILLPGDGGRLLTPARYLRRDKRPITNLYLSLADRMGCHELEAYGDSTGRLNGI